MFRSPRSALVLLLALNAAQLPAGREAGAQVRRPIEDSWASPGIEAEAAARAATLGLRPRAARPMLLGPAGLIGSVPSVNVQAEVSLAAWGSTVLVGTNDFRWASLAGYMRSSDGGDTYADGGPFPTPAGWTGNGDPAFAVWDSPGGPVYYFAQLMTAPGTIRQVALFRSVDGGVTWAGPFTIGPTAIAGESPDRHSICVDPETGRLHLAWTHFGAVFGIRVIYSDDASFGSPPTWSAATLIGTRPQDGQATTILADPAGPGVVLGWQTYWSPGVGDRGVAVARSLDNGTTWLPVVDVDGGPFFWHHIVPYGFDRWLWSFSGSSLALNPVDGSLHMVYAASATGTPAGDFGDIYYRRSADFGLTWSPPVPLNVFPGTDRAQCFPAVSCTRDGRVDVVWYDQSSGSGRSDDTDLYYCFSTSSGASWSSPVPVTPTPMRCESGNNFGFPHQGDYIDAVRSEGPAAPSLFHAGFTAFASPSPFTTGADPMGFTNGSTVQVAPLRLRPGTVTIADRGCGTNDGKLVANEAADLGIPLENIGRTGLTSISATLSTSTPGVSIAIPTETYPPIASGASALSLAPFAIVLSSSFPCGADIAFRLDISAAGVAPTYVEFTLPTGVVSSSTLLLSESFDGVAAPALPAGWAAVNLGATANNWVTTAALPASPPNAAFVPGSLANSFGRLQGPAVAVPPGTNYVEVTFDTRHELPEYDARYTPDGGSFDYLLDGVGGSHFGSGDATEIDYRYTHNVQRASGSNSGDRHGWAGSSGGYRAVRFRFPGMAGHSLRPRFDYTTVGGGGTGWWVDNVKVTAYTLGCGSCSPTPTLVQRFEAEPAQDRVTLRWSSDATGRVESWNLYRSNSAEGAWRRLNPEPIPMRSGGTFEWVDRPAEAGTYYYRLGARVPEGVEYVVQMVPVAFLSAPVPFAVSLAGANPFHDLTHLRITLPAAGPVRVDLYDVSGQRVRTLLDEGLGAGTHSLPVERFGPDGRRIGPGVYLARVQAANQSRTVRLIALD